MFIGEYIEISRAYYDLHQQRKNIRNVIEYKNTSTAVVQISPQLFITSYRFVNIALRFKYLS